MINALTDTAMSHVGAQVLGHSHGRWFMHVPEETVQPQMRRFAFSHNFLRLSAETTQTQLVEVSSGETLYLTLQCSRKAENIYPTIFRRGILA